MPNTFRPQWASYKITETTPSRLTVTYNPLAYLILGGIMSALCLYAGISTLRSGSTATGLLWIGAAALFCGAFCGLFYHRITLIFERSFNRVKMVSRQWWRTHTETLPLTGLKAAFDTSFSGDTSVHRLLLIPPEGEPLRPTVALISGPSVIAASEAINRWLDAGN